NPHMSTMPRRTTTRDVDILLRAFAAAVDRVNANHAVLKLKEAIKKTAQVHFPGMLGLDWMNADADVALPLGIDPATNQPFDPLHVSSLTSQNRSLYTVYTSPNGFLELVSIPPYWMVALKLVRWGRRDWGDVGVLLRNGTLLSNTKWTAATLIAWLESNCWAMGYAKWDERKKMEMDERITQAIAMVEGWN
ncbi:hypothetical protein CPC08DRAFT_614287, partial [Agrocybe pediades]